MKKTLLVMILTLLSSCSDSSTSTQDIQAMSSGLTPADTNSITGGIRYNVITSEEGEDDASLPMGYWQSMITYPQIEGLRNKNISDSINDKIARLSKEYSCEQKGDYSFTASVKLLKPSLFSMSYEVMWHCPGMPSPDSSMDSLNYNLLTGEPIKLESEFKSTVGYNQLRAITTDRINAIQKSSPECPTASNYTSYYITESSLVFMIDMARHEDSGCNSEITVEIASIAEFLKADSVLLK